jgi:hypothetical protein
LSKNAAQSVKPTSAQSCSKPKFKITVKATLGRNCKIKLPNHTG